MQNNDHAVTEMNRNHQDPPAPLTVLRNDLERWNSDLSVERCIYRVPPRMRGDGSLYTPKIVSIGPIHHGGEGLQAMEEYKHRFLNDFLDRLDLSFDDYAKFISTRELDLRKHYSDTINLTSDEFTKIFMVDAAFLVMLLVKQREGVTTATGCRIFGKPGMKLEIIGDLVLLENQLPLFILHDILQKWFGVTGPGGATPLIYNLLRCRLDLDLSQLPINTPERVQGCNPVHILDLLRNCHIPDDMEAISMAVNPANLNNRPANVPDNTENPQLAPAVVEIQGCNPVDFLRNCLIPYVRRADVGDQENTQLDPAVVEIQANPVVDVGTYLRQRRREREEKLYVPSADELHKVGLKFGPSKLGLFSIHLINGVLMVPCMHIGTSSETTYRNLLAFEQCHCQPRERIFTDYFYLLDKLVNTSQDIDLLVKNKILMNTLGESGDAANVFNRMSQGLKTSNETYFSGIYQDLTVFYEKCSLKKWAADLQQNYCYSPCATASVAAAGFLICLTMAQLCYAMASYYAHKS